MAKPARLLLAVALSFALVTQLRAQADPRPHVLVLSDQADRVLRLVYSAHATELLGCLLGGIHGDTALVERIAPADVDPVHSTPTHVLPKQNCEEAGWGPTVGTIHNHPGAGACWFLFPGTRVPTSDGQSLLRSPYAIEAILCGPQVVWITRDMEQRELRLHDEAAPPE